MAANIQEAQELLFGKEGLGASNFKLFPGNDRDTTSDEIAGEIAASLKRVLAGEAEEIAF